MRSPNQIDSYDFGQPTVEAIDNLLNEISLRCKAASVALQVENLSPAKRSMLETERNFASKQAIDINSARWLIINALKGEI